MQQHAPDAVDLSGESQATHELYGMDRLTRAFGRKGCRSTAGRT